MPVEPLLGVEGLCKRFAGLLAVDDVSFSVRRGEIMGLIGPNGAGKTTTFNLVSGRFAPTAGRVRLDGQDIVGVGVDRIVGLGLARTFQGTRLFPGLSVEENLSVPLLARDNPGVLAEALRLPGARRFHAAVARRVAEVMEFVGLAHLRHSVAGSLAYAHQSLLGIGLALVRDPKVLLLDEPFAGMNPSETEAASAMVRQIRDHGVTVLLVEHDVSGRDGHLRPDRGAGPRPQDRRGHAGRGTRDPAVIEAYLGVDEDAEPLHA